MAKTSITNMEVKKNNRNRIYRSDGRYLRYHLVL